MYQSSMEDCQIIEQTTWEWTMDPHNASYLDVNSYLIMQTSPIEFVGIPLL